MFYIYDDTRINGEIRAKEVRLIGANGEQLGVIATRKAMEMAEEAGLDLVEVAANAKPVVCKILDYGKFKYEKGKKEKEAKKNQKVVVVKEIKVKARIDQHDLGVKIGKIEKFLSKEYKVKVTLMLFGRERMYADLGIAILEKVANHFDGDAIIERNFSGATPQKFIIISPKLTK